MKFSNREGGVGRRGFLKLSGGLLATTATAATTGCLNADADDEEAEIGYRDWIPASADPVVMYTDVTVLSQHHSMWEGEGDAQYGLTFDDVAEVVGTSEAEVLVLNEDAEPDIADDEGTAWDDYGGYTVHQRDSEAGGFVATDGDVVIEAQTQDAIESVIDAHAGDTARLHEEDETFEGLTTKAGEGDLVVVPGVNGRGIRRKQARSADVSEETSEVRIAIEADEEEFGDVEDGFRSRDHLTVNDVEEDAEAGIILLKGTVETESVPDVFGLVGEASSSQGAHDEGSERDESSESTGESARESESVTERESEAEAGGGNETESE
ncbi:MAG: hypothetical protein U5J64_06630 [Halobacteriales archaeon]|nr:hypothetical protein [Halobacteriales archaeon]